MNFPFLHRFLFSQEFMIVFLFHLLSVLYSYYEFNPSCVNPLSVCPNIKRSITFIFPRKSFLEHCGSAPVQSGWLLCLLPSYYPVISFHHQPRSFHLFFEGEGSDVLQSMLSSFLVCFLTSGGTLLQYLLEKVYLGDTLKIFLCTSKNSFYLSLHLIITLAECGVLW